MNRANIRRLIWLTAVLSALPAQAEVFKCQSRSGKTTYQSEPCAPSARKQQVLEIQQMTPEQREDAQEKLRDWRERQAAEEAARAEAEQAQRIEQDRREALELQRRSVRAQEQQAIAAQRQPPARPYVPYYPYWPYQWPGTGYSPAYPPYQDHHGGHRYQGPYSPWRQSQPPIMPPPQPRVPQPRRPNNTILGPGR